jgi:uncharacterized protein (DUF58 family)
MPRRPVAVPLPTPRLAALVAVVGVALFAWPGRSVLVLLVLNAVLVLAFAVDALQGTSPSKVVVTREHPESVRVGDTVELAWVIEHRGTHRVHAMVSDAIWPSLAAQRRSVRVALAPASRVRLRTTITPTRRGRFPLDAITVRVTGPWRLAVRQATRPVPTSVRVMPAYPSRDDVRRRMRVPRQPDVGVRAIRTAGGGTEFDQLREYRPDDEFRRIDWASSMRLQRPIVKQYRTERNQNVVLLLDNGRVMAGTVAGAPRVEHAMDAVLGLAEAVVFMSDRVGLLCFDRQVRSIVPSGSSRSQLGRVAEAMYLLEPDLAESAYTSAFSSAAARFRRRSLYVVLTDLAAATVQQALLPALAILVRTHLVVVASVRDPIVTGWAHPDDVDWASEAYRQSAAISALDQRERAAALLRATGAIVVDAEPGQLAVRLVDTYLELKASGRL